MQVESKNIVKFFVGLGAGLFISSQVFAPTVAPKLNECSAVANFGGKYYLFSDEQDKMFVCSKLSEAKTATPATWNIPSADDKEGAAMDVAGNLWICTSHSAKKDGSVGTNRRRIIRVTNPTSNQRKIETFDKLCDILLAATNCPQVIKDSIGKKEADAGLNIEGIAFVPDPNNPMRSMLLIGLRSPLVNKLTGDAWVIQVQFPERFFGTSPKPSDLGLSFYAFALSNLGVRDMYWDSGIQRLFMIGGGRADGNADRVLYKVNYTTRHVDDAKLLKINAEAVTKEVDGMTVLSDDADTVQTAHIKYEVMR